MKERLVLFIADAGLGKTVEMRHLAHSVSESNPYMRPVFFYLIYPQEVDPAGFVLLGGSQNLTVTIPTSEGVIDKLIWTLKKS